MSRAAGPGDSLFMCVPAPGFGKALMKFRRSILASKISGCAGPLAFVHGAKTPYIRTRPSIVPDASAGQTEVRETYGQLVSFWNSLDSAEKLTWNDGAEERSVSGFNYFVQVNFSLRRADEPLYITPPSLDVYAPTHISTRVWPEADDPVVCFVPHWPSGNSLFAHYEDPIKNAFWGNGTEPADDVDLLRHENQWWGDREDSYVMDSDTPANTNGVFGNLTASNPGGITQIEPISGLKMNRYTADSTYNAYNDAGISTFDADEDWAISFWLTIYDLSTAGAGHLVFRASESFDVRRSSSSQDLTFKWYAATSNQSMIITTPYRGAPFFVTVLNLPSEDLRAVYYNLVLQDSAAITSAGAVSSGLKIRMNCLAGSSTDYRIALGAPVFWSSRLRWESQAWEYVLRNSDMRSWTLSRTVASALYHTNITQLRTPAVGLSGCLRATPLDVDE